MKRSGFLLVFTLALGFVLQGQGSPTCTIVGRLHGSWRSPPTVPALWTTSIFLSKEGLVSEIRAVPSGTKDARQGSLQAVYSRAADGNSGSCLITVIDTYSSGDPIQAKSELRWTYDADTEMYAISVHRSSTSPLPDGQMQRGDRSASLYFGDKEAYWATRDQTKDGPVVNGYRWTYEKQVENSYFFSNLALSINVLDGKGFYQPDLPVLRVRYESSDKDLRVAVSLRYAGYGAPDADWMGPETWKLSGSIPKAKDVFTTVLTYLVLEEWFSSNCLALFGHSLFGIQMR